MEVPAARVFLKCNTEQLEPALSFNARYRWWIRFDSLAVCQHFPRFYRFKIIPLLAAQCFMLLTSSVVESVLSLLTGMLMVISSANFTIRFLPESANCMSLTIKENKVGPRTVPRS